MKGKVIALAALISILVCGMSSISKTQEEGTNNRIEVEVEGANIKFEMSDSNEVETEYYGTGSDEIYDLVTLKDGDNYKIILNRIGTGIAPTIKEGGVVVKVPDRNFGILSINGKRGSGIVLDGINIDGNITTKSSAVVINNEDGGSKISINSDHDSYKINSVPMLENFELKALGSVVDFIFTEQPLNLKFQLGDGYAELPSDWSRDFTIGLGEPKMIVEVVRGIFRLSIDN